MSGERCPFCQTERDDPNDLLTAKTDCGAMGEMRADVQIFCYDARFPATLDLYVWLRAENGGALDDFYKELARAVMDINFCPMCGRDLRRTGYVA